MLKAFVVDMGYTRWILNLQTFKVDISQEVLSKPYKNYRFSHEIASETKCILYYTIIECYKILICYFLPYIQLR